MKVTYFTWNNCDDAGGVCDRTGFFVAYSDLQKQKRYAGSGLLDTGYIVRSESLFEANPSGKVANIRPTETIDHPRPGPTDFFVC